MRVNVEQVGLYLSVLATIHVHVQSNEVMYTEVELKPVFMRSFRIARIMKLIELNLKRQLL